MTPQKKYLAFLLFLALLATILLIIFRDTYYDQEALTLKTQKINTSVKEEINKNNLAQNGAIDKPMTLLTLDTREDQVGKYFEEDLKELYKKYLISPELEKVIPNPGPVLAQSLYVVSGSTLPGFGPVPFPAGADDDSWKSNDGISYSNVVTDSAFMDPNGVGSSGYGRMDGALVYFKNKVWMVGGYGNAGCKNDVWSSPDGTKNWRRELKSAPWEGRMDHTVTVYKNNLYLIGGVSCGGSGFLSLLHAEEVWMSPDGVTWKKVNPGSLPFPGRAGHTSVVFNNKIYVLGGYGSTGTLGSHNYSQDVYSSSDGKDWSKVTAPWPARANHASVVYGGKMWVIGGARINPSGYQIPYFGMLSVPNGIIYSDVWSSSNGTNWVLNTANASFGKRAGHSAVVIDGKMNVIGGSGVFTGNYIYKDSYSSNNGVSWNPSSYDNATHRTESHAVVTPLSYGNGTFLFPDVSSVQATSTTTDVEFKGFVDTKGLPTTAWFEYMYYIGSFGSSVLETSEVSIGTIPTQVSATLSGQVPGSNYFYRLVSQNANGLVRGPVLNQFTQGCNASIANPMINIIYPNGGEIFTAGQQVTVTWNSCLMSPSDLVDIGIVNNPPVLISNTPNDGSETITLPLSLSGSNYKFIIRKSIVNSPFDNSNSGITIQ